jgi:3-oxoacyl-[acyl-carrier-protein] synthase II
VILEDLKHACRRSSNIYGEVIGCSSTNDAYDIHEIDPAGGGLYRSMKNALHEARLIPQEIDYISAHAPSMILTDKVETAAIKRLFGECAYRIPVSSVKSMIGQPLAATGTLQVISCLLGFRDHILPPTTNYESPDPECDLDCVPNKARQGNIETALINSYGFGGLNATLVIRAMNNLS